MEPTTWGVLDKETNYVINTILYDGNRLDETISYFDSNGWYIKNLDQYPYVTTEWVYSPTHDSWYKGQQILDSQNYILSGLSSQLDKSILDSHAKAQESIAAQAAVAKAQELLLQIEGQKNSFIAELASAEEAYSVAQAALQETAPEAIYPAQEAVLNAQDWVARTRQLIEDYVQKEQEARIAYDLELQNAEAARISELSAASNVEKERVNLEAIRVEFAQYSTPPE